MDGDLPVQGKVSEPGAVPGGYRALGRVLLWGLLLAPIALSLLEVLRSPRMNTWDFWVLLGRSTYADGTLNPRSFTVLFNEHPAVTVILTFWADAKLFAGSQWVLGAVAFLLGLAMFAALWRMLPPRLTGTPRLAVLTTLSLLVFSSAAVEYYGAGWMGIQWFLGLAPAVVALSFAHHGRTVPAVLLGVLASLGHGSGFPVWIALGLVAWLRRDRLWRVVLPLALGVVVLVLWRLASVPGPAAPGISGVDTYLGSTMTALGRAWGAQSPDVGMITGAATLAAIGFAVVTAARTRVVPVDGTPATPDDAGWIGLAVHAALAAAMVGLSRGTISNIEGLSARYAVIGLLATAALVALLALRAPQAIKTRTVPIVLAIGLGSYAVGSTSASETRQDYLTQPVLAAAMVTGADSVVKKMNGYPEYLPRFRALGVYPFTGDFTLGCGVHGGPSPELGARLDLASARPLTAALDGDALTAGVVEAAGGDAKVNGDTDLRGWAFVDGDQPDCVLVTDADGEVSGGGAVGLPRRDVGVTFGVTGRAGWEATAKPSVKGGAVLAVKNGKLYRLAVIAAK
ncbi:hypothetical protein [Amycolatopsis sp. H20-H5]|uniref:hypothetical protein n=1 Tax=Amycolatopsis sp. H20-H5 TaxID=3046309 RepID=UPI002DBEC90E|nr:hypothetical protein [Amycolatopsis sp. H20-H5]MEC3981423.1 hypothetical protein [Amycolatopsis sp. H20-H5]